MDFKKEYKKLLEIVKADLTANGLPARNEDIAATLDYSHGALRNLIGESGKVTQKHINALKSRFPVLSDNITPGIYRKSRLDRKLSGKPNRIPYYDAQASGGLIETDMTAIHAPAGTIDVGDLLHDSQAAIRIYGNSMNPNYPPGCVVGLTKVTNAFIEPGEVYVIETTDNRMLKRLFYNNDDPESDMITCYSDNLMKFEGGSRNGKPAYPPFNLPKKEIKNLFMVTGVIKRNSNSIIINRKP